MDKDIELICEICTDLRDAVIVLPCRTSVQRAVKEVLVSAVDHLTRCLAQVKALRYWEGG